MDGMARGSMISPDAESIRVSGLVGGRSYEIALVVFPKDKEKYDPTMSNILVRIISLFRS